MSCEYRILSDFSPEFLRSAARLYRIAGWVDEADPCDFLSSALRNSCAVCAACCGETLVGMGRALGDGVSDAYIQDVVVDPGFRRRGIGGGIVRALAAELRRRGVDWIGPLPPDSPSGAFGKTVPAVKCDLMQFQVRRRKFSKNFSRFFLPF